MISPKELMRVIEVCGATDTVAEETSREEEGKSVIFSEECVAHLRAYKQVSLHKSSGTLTWMSATFISVLITATRMKHSKQDELGESRIDLSAASVTVGRGHTVRSPSVTLRHCHILWSRRE